METKEGKIYKQLALAVKDIGAVEKGGVNRQWLGPNSDGKFRKIDDVYTAVNKAMGKHLIFYIPNTLSIKQEQVVSAKGIKGYRAIVEMEYQFYADDGSNIKFKFFGEATDWADKSVSKASTMADKYMLVKVFCIPFGDGTDGDAYDPKQGKVGGSANSHKVSTPRKNNTNAKPPSDPKRNDMLNRIKELMTSYVPRHQEMTDEDHRTEIRNTFATMFGFCPSELGNKNNNELTEIIKSLTGNK